MADRSKKLPRIRVRRPHRSARRLLLAAACVLVSIVLLMAAFVFPAQLAEIDAFLAMLGSAVDASLATVLILLIAVFLLAVATRLLWPRRLLSVAAPKIDQPATVSVHLDWENQRMSGKTLTTFLAYLDAAIDGRPVERFFYCDASLSANDMSYRTLWRSGFRPIDVVHQHGDTNHVANIVDFELALHAYQRALTATAPMHFIIISRDQGYLPLLYRLRAAGHTVSIWAKEMPASYRNLRRVIGVDAIDLRSILQQADAEEMPVFSSNLARTSSVDVSALSSIAQQSVAPLIAPVDIVISQGQLQSVLKKTQNSVKEIAAHQSLPKQQLATFQERASAVLPMLEWLGFGETAGAFAWLQFLVLLGVLKGGTKDRLPAQGVANTEHSAKKLYLACQLVVARIRLLATDYADGTIPFAALHQEILRPPVRDQPKIGFIQMAIKNDPSMLWRVCDLCKALGLLEFTRNADNGSITIKGAGGGAHATHGADAAAQ